MIVSYLDVSSCIIQRSSPLINMAYLVPLSTTRDRGCQLNGAEESTESETNEIRTSHPPTYMYLAIVSANIVL